MSTTGRDLFTDTDFVDLDGKLQLQMRSIRTLPRSVRSMSLHDEWEAFQWARATMVAAHSAGGRIPGWLIQEISEQVRSPALLIG